MTTAPTPAILSLDQDTTGAAHLWVYLPLAALDTPQFSQLLNRLTARAPKGVRPEYILPAVVAAAAINGSSFAYGFHLPLTAALPDHADLTDLRYEVACLITTLLGLPVQVLASVSEALSYTGPMAYRTYHEVRDTLALYEAQAANKFRIPLDGLVFHGLSFN